MRAKRFNIKLTSDEIKFIQQSMIVYVSHYNQFRSDASYPEGRNYDSSNLALDISRNMQESREKQLTERQLQEEFSNGHGWLY